MTRSAHSDGPATVRLFVAIPMPAEARRLALAVQRELRHPALAAASATPAAKLHLTLKFLGETADTRVPTLVERLRAVAFAPFTAVLDQLGTFPGRGQPRILWLHLAGAELLALQRRVDAALAPDYAPERRFMSHVTIARFKRVPDPRGLLAAVAAHHIPPTPMTVTHFALVRSTLAPTGAVYAEIERFTGAPTASARPAASTRGDHA